MGAAKPSTPRDRVEFYSLRAQANSGTTHGVTLSGLAQAWATVVLADAVAASKPAPAPKAPQPTNLACSCGHPEDMHHGPEGPCRAATCACQAMWPTFPRTAP